MQLLELTATHSLERCENRPSGPRITWVLHRWRPSSLRRSGMYVPVTEPLSASSMLRVLEERQFGSDALSRFRRVMHGPHDGR